MRTSRRLLLVALGATIMVVSACGSSDDASSPSADTTVGTIAKPAGAKENSIIVPK